MIADVYGMYMYTKLPGNELIDFSTPSIFNMPSTYVCIDTNNNTRPSCIAALSIEKQTVNGRFQTRLA